VPGGKKEAAVTQNLGACYNALGDYQRALGFHEQALENYSMLSHLELDL
jgi:tetratricopeptide (TPR) repeat protein